MPKLQKHITRFDGANIAVYYFEGPVGISLYETKDAETGQNIYLNISQQKQIKKQIGEEV